MKKINFSLTSKLIISTVILGSTLGGGVYSKKAMAESLHYTTQNTIFSANSLKFKTSIVPEATTIYKHSVKYSKSHFQSEKNIPKEFYYSSQGFKGYIQLSTIADKGDHFIVVYSGTVIRC
ncbi:hypothetical protein U0X36_05725 [Bacillus thuringiensis]|uniref:hypothetical protein n=1 Tax=Bacillus thuringiensis TaxID=1428 RepID=UPI000E4B8EE3|nr:hypothetical protein [Bacillus thuringiensis]MDZ3952439.1 hypothetical protein [Bacillus thuringiensis]RGP45256.1 hypothetical protein BTW32_26240 [Bacillus thuringiensis]